MKLTIENTNRMVLLENAHGSMEARIWEGKSEDGVEVICFITRVMVRRDADNARFERELTEQRVASDAAAAIPLRLII